MNYYIQGDAARADQIKAAFEKLGYDISWPEGCANPNVINIGVERNGAKYVVAETSEYITVSLNDIKPIPLTEEILEKNGFSEIHHPGTGATDEYSEWFLGGIKITEWLEDWKDHHFSTGGDDCSISFNYVHQLQHLLRLVGIKKEIGL